MTDIEAMLKAVAPDPEAPSADVVARDLARGRAALTVAYRRRRIRRAGLAAASLLVIVIAGLLIGDSLSRPTRSGGGHPSAGHTRIRLVDYTGAQLAGFTVAQVPAGWHLSTSTSTALLVTPDGSANDDPYDFEGKLAVLTASVDQHGLGGGAAVTVNGRPGRVRTSDGVLMLTYDAPGMSGVVIQAPAALGWGAAQIVAFAQGVHVTANAVHAYG